MQIKLQETLDDQGFTNSTRRAPRQRRVRYQDDTEDIELKAYNPGLVKEDIQIPSPPPRHITRAEHIIAAAMSGGERQMHGLTGKALV